MKAGRVLAALCGLSLGLGAVLVGERERLEAGPPGWAADAPDIPVYLSSLAGPPRLPGQGWPLGSRWSLRHAERAARSVEAVVDLPAGSSLSVGLAAPGGRSLVLSARRLGTDSVTLHFRDERNPEATGLSEPVGCDQALVLPAEGPVRLGLGPGDGHGLVATVGEQQVRCSRDLPPGQAVLHAGLRRVGLHRLVVGEGPAEQAPGPAWGLRLAGAGAGAAVGLGAVAAGRRRGLREAVVAAVLLPLLLATPLALLDLEGWLQGTRVLLEHPLRFGLALPLVGTAGLAAAVGGARILGQPGAPPLWAVALAGGLAGLVGPVALGAGGWLAVPAGAGAALLLALLAGVLGPEAGPRRAAMVAAGGALLLGMVVALARPAWGQSALGAAGAGAALGVLLWANVRASQVRAFNLVSLLCLGLAVAGAEHALTWSETGQRLVGASNRPLSTVAPKPAGGSPVDDFVIIDRVRTYTTYPSEGYPVAPAPRSAPVRIIALGSSSTGGAFQNDDLAQFWPADLDRLLGDGVQVVNQGVGGWTSLHLRRYVETRLSDLDADLLVIYQGNNDLKQPSAKPYRELYAEQLGQATEPSALAAWLRSVRLYQLLRFSLLPATRHREGSAVPLPDARDNLQAIIDLARAQGIPVLLVREGTFPDPLELEPYGELMAELARQEGVAWIDGGKLLDQGMAWELYLDNVHLTRRGHEVLARAIADRLVELGWVQPPG